VYLFRLSSVFFEKSQKLKILKEESLEKLCDKEYLDFLAKHGYEIDKDSYCEKHVGK